MSGSQCPAKPYWRLRQKEAALLNSIFIKNSNILFNVDFFCIDFKYYMKILLILIIVFCCHFQFCTKGEGSLSSPWPGFGGSDK